jgi:hypothetical protein
MGAWVIFVIVVLAILIIAAVRIVRQYEHAEGEHMAADTLAQAAQVLQGQPAALQLRYLQTVVEMSGERNSTIIPLTLDIASTLSGTAKSLKQP